MDVSGGDLEGRPPQVSTTPDHLKATTLPEASLISNHCLRTSAFTESGSGTYSSSAAILSPEAYAQSKNFSVVIACAGFSCALCIMMNVAPVSGQASLPGWSVST